MNSNQSNILQTEKCDCQILASKNGYINSETYEKFGNFQIYYEI